MRTQRRSAGLRSSLHLVALLVFFSVLAMAPAAAFATGDVFWTLRDSGTSGNLQSVFFTDANTGWAVGQAGYARKTINGGETWVAQYASTLQLNGVYFVDANNGWAVGDGALLQQTTNGGTSWTGVGFGIPTTFYAVHMYDAGTGWIVGGAGTIIKGTINPTTWAYEDSHTSAALKSVHFFDANTGWVVGDSGTISKTINGGTTWTTQVVGAQNLNGVDFVNATTGWAVGSAGTIIKTVDGGTTWTPQASGTNATLYSVKFADANYGWAVGASGTIRRTTNGGTTWTGQTSGVSDALRSVYFAGTENGCAVGDAGTILKATNQMPVSRFFNMRTGSHFYTADAAEKASVQANLSAIYHYDGIAYYVITGSPDNIAPLWRFYNMRTGAHFYTIDPAEKANLQTNMAAIYHYDGVAYNVCPTHVLNSATVWRFFNVRNQTHFYTADPAERNTVLTTLQSTYHLDGPAFYLAP